MSLYGGLYDSTTDAGAKDNKKSLKATLQFVPKKKVVAAKKKKLLITVGGNKGGGVTVNPGQSLLSSSVSTNNESEPFNASSTDLIHAQVKNNPNEYNPHEPNEYTAYVSAKTHEDREQRERDRKEAELRRKERHDRRCHKHYPNSGPSSNANLDTSNSSSISSGGVDVYNHSRSNTSSNITVTPSQPAKINLNESAAEAIARRIAMSKGLTYTPTSNRTPQPTQNQIAPQTPVGNSNAANLSGATKVLMLENMVGPGEVDDDLQPEVKEECSKYGKVESCLVFELPKGTVADDRAVRIFVHFKTLDASRKGFLDLNGRFFGGRKVRASFYNEEKFRKFELLS